MNPLNQPQRDLCFWTGMAGIGVSLTCIIQLLVVMNAHWLAFIILGLHTFTLVTFVFLALQKSLAPPLLIASSVTLLLVEAIMLAGLVFSLIVLLHLLYTVAITVIIYMQDIPYKLRLKAAQERLEANEWSAKFNG